jgi:hypothetical protein
MRITTLFRSEIVGTHLGHERAEQTVGLVVWSGGEAQSIGVGVQEGAEEQRPQPINAEPNSAYRARSP